MGIGGGLTDGELATLSQLGDRASRDELLTRFRPRVEARARGYFLVAGEADDLVQEGMIGLLQAIMGYRPDRGASFRSFAELCVQRSMIDAIRAATARRHQPLTRYVSIPVQADDEPCPWRFVSDDDPARTVIQAEEAAQVRGTLLYLLSRFELEILHRHLGGETHHEIAGVVGRDRKSIENALHRIRRKVEDHLALGRTLTARP